MYIYARYLYTIYTIIMYNIYIYIYEYAQKSIYKYMQDIYIPYIQYKCIYMQEIVFIYKPASVLHKNIRFIIYRH